MGHFQLLCNKLPEAIQSISEVLIHPQMRRFSMPHKYHDTLWCFLRDRSKERALSSHFGSDHSVTHIEISHQYMFIHVFFTIEMHFLFHDQPTKMISLLNLIKHGKQTQWEQVMVKKNAPVVGHKPTIEISGCLGAFGLLALGVTSFICECPHHRQGRLTFWAKIHRKSIG